MKIRLRKFRLSFVNLFLTGLLLLTFEMHGQRFGEGKTEQALEQEAFVFFEQKEYQKAMPIYKELLSVYPLDPEYNYYLGVCQVETNTQIVEAIKYLRIASENDVNSMAPYYLARAFHLNYQFNLALPYYQKFKKDNRKRSKNIDHLIEMCSHGLSIVNTYSDIDVVGKSIVTHQDFFQNYDLTGFSNRIAKKKSSFKSRLDSSGNLDITVLSADRNYIYFSGMLKNKKNGQDLYWAKRLKNGKWGPIIPLNILNTPYDEIFPFVSTDGKILYFCSKGHNSMGGFDIFKSTFNEANETWSKPENLGFPINSTSDDMFFATDMNDEYASFASSRATENNRLTIYKIKLEADYKQKLLENTNDLTKIALLKEKHDTVPKPVPHTIRTDEPIAKHTIPVVKKYTENNIPYFNFRISKQLVYHTLGDFRSKEARSLFVEVKNDKHVIDSLNNLMYNMKSRLKVVTGGERNSLVQRISSIEPQIYTLSKSTRDKISQTLDLERNHLKQLGIGGMERITEVSTGSQEKHFSMESNVVPVKEDVTNASSAVVQSTSPNESGIVFRVQIGTFSKRPPDSYFNELGIVLEEKTDNGSLKYMLGSYKILDQVNADLPEIQKVFPEAYVVAYKNGKKIGVKQAVKESQEYYDQQIRMASENQFQEPVYPSNENSIEFRVQVGAYSKNVPEYILGKLRRFEKHPIKRIKTGDGYTICTVGAFKSHATASELKMKLRETGLSDAFVVAYKNDERIHVKQAIEELIENRENTRVIATSRSEEPVYPSKSNKVEFRVQVGVYSGDVPRQILAKLKVFREHEIKLTKNTKGHTVCSIGVFNLHISASKLQEKLREAGLSDAFIVAYKGKQRIPFKEALRFTQQ